MTLEQQVSRSLWRQRLQESALGAFAVLAVVLTVIGIYGVIAYTVAQRTRELGVRLALGARREQVLMMILLQASRLAVVGVAIGLAAALVLAMKAEWRGRSAGTGCGDRTGGSDGVRRPKKRVWSPRRRHSVPRTRSDPRTRSPHSFRSPHTVPALIPGIVDRQIAALNLSPSLSTRLGLHIGDPG